MKTAQAAANDDIFEALIANEESRELSSAVEQLRSVNEPAARSLVGYADSVAADARDRMFNLIRQHPEGHGAVLSLLRTVLTWLEADRRSDDLCAGQRRDLDFAERYVREIARFILRERL